MKLGSKYTKLFIHKNAFENVVCEMAAILSRGDELTYWIEQNGRHLAGDISNTIFLNCCILLTISLKIVHMGPIKIKPGYISLVDTDVKHTNTHI